MAHLTFTATDTQLEPPNLIPSMPSLRPADIGLQLRPSPKQPKTFLAIDVTITSTPKPPSFALSPDQPVSSDTHKAHDTSAKLKFNVPHAHFLAYHDILLLPFTIDHLGGIGSFAHNFLFGKTKPAIPPNAPAPPWTSSSFPTNPAAFVLTQTTLKHLPTNILQDATHTWSQGQSQPRQFGRSYHTRTPTQWATQALALNLTLALATHLQTNIVSRQNLQQRPTQKRAAELMHQFPPFYLPPPPFLGPTELNVALPVPTPDSIPRANPHGNVA